MKHNERRKKQFFSTVQGVENKLTVKAQRLQFVPWDAFDLIDEYAGDKARVFLRLRIEGGAECYLRWVVRPKLDPSTGASYTNADLIVGEKLDDDAMLVGNVQFIDVVERFVLASRVWLVFAKEANNATIKTTRVFSALEGSFKRIRIIAEREVAIPESTPIGAADDLRRENEGKLVQGGSKVVYRISEDAIKLYRDRTDAANLDDLLRAITIQLGAHFVDARVSPCVKPRAELIDVLLSAVDF